MKNLFTSLKSAIQPPFVREERTGGGRSNRSSKRSAEMLNGVESRSTRSHLSERYSTINTPSFGLP